MGVFGAWVWLPLAMLLLLLALLVALGTTPRTVVYGRDLAESWVALRSAAVAVDPAAIGDEKGLQMHLPTARLHVRVEGAPGHDVTAIVPFEAVVTDPAWPPLRAELRRTLRQQATVRGGRGALITLVGLLMLAYAAYVAWQDPAAVAEQARRWWFRDVV